MTTKEIDVLFEEVISKKAIYTQLEGISEDKIYNIRKGRIKITLGDKLNILYQLKRIEIIKTNEPA